VIVVDHGSRRVEANQRHEAFVGAWAEAKRFPVVEAAHMELAEPSIDTAFDACVAAGATTVVIAPYFLWPATIGPSTSRPSPERRHHDTRGFAIWWQLHSAPTRNFSTSSASGWTAAWPMSPARRPSARCAPATEAVDSGDRSRVLPVTDVVVVGAGLSGLTCVVPAPPVRRNPVGPRTGGVQPPV